MTNSKLLEQFRSFYFRNYPDDMEIQISYFAVFGGLGWDIDTSKPINELIQEIILENFDVLNSKNRDYDKLYSNIQEQLKSNTLALYSADDFEALVKNSSKDELIENFI